MPRSDPRADQHLVNVLGMVALDVVTGVHAAIEDATGLSTVQATALSALANYADGGSVDELRHSVRLSHSATVRLVDRLAEQGLVERRESALDGRVSAVHLTRAGRTTVRRIQRVRGRHLEAVVQTLSPAQRAALVPVLDQLATRNVNPERDGAALALFVCRLCDPDACGHPEGCPVTAVFRGDDGG